MTLMRGSSITREKICGYIAEYYSTHGFGPSYREISSHVHLKSLSTVHGHIQRLMRDGLISANPDQPRSIVPTEKLYALIHSDCGDKFSHTDSKKNDSLILIQPYLSPVVFGDLLARIRKSKMMTKEELAKRAGVAYRTVCAHERGEQLPTRSTICKYADALQIPTIAPVVLGASVPRQKSKEI